MTCGIELLKGILFVVSVFCAPAFVSCLVPVSSQRKSIEETQKQELFVGPRWGRRKVAHLVVLRVRRSANQCGGEDSAQLWEKVLSPRGSVARTVEGR
jgi:hypothetical protein